MTPSSYFNLWVSGVTYIVVKHYLELKYLCKHPGSLNDCEMSHEIIFQVLKANINYLGNINFKLGDRDDLLWKHKLQWSKKLCTVKLLHAMQLPSPLRHIIHSEDGRLNPTFSDVFSGIKRKHWEEKGQKNLQYESIKTISWAQKP